MIQVCISDTISLHIGYKICLLLLWTEISKELLKKDLHVLPPGEWSDMWPVVVILVTAGEGWSKRQLEGNQSDSISTGSSFIGFARVAQF